jgi:hypothetical protein
MVMTSRYPKKIKRDQVYFGFMSGILFVVLFLVLFAHFDSTLFKQSFAVGARPSQDLFLSFNVANIIKISDTEGGFLGELDDVDRFGGSITSLGDLDRDGIGDIAVGAYMDDDGGHTRGAMWILFLRPNGTVKSHQKISSLEGDFKGQLNDGDMFGRSATTIGDLDGDGVVDLAVGAHGDTDGGPRRGAIWILFLNSDGTIRDFQKISSLEGNFTGEIKDHDMFGHGITSLGDFNGDGIIDLAVSSLELGNIDRGGTIPPGNGILWILFMNRDGTVGGHTHILPNVYPFDADIISGDSFGYAMTSLGDLDGDGVTDIAVGADGDDDGGRGSGAVWILYLDFDGAVKGYAKLSNTAGNISGYLTGGFGSSLTTIADRDNNGTRELIVGARRDDGGAVWVIDLSRNGVALSDRKINDTTHKKIDPGDMFGRSVSSIGDINRDGLDDIAVGAMWDDDGGINHGAAWLLLLPKVAPRVFSK